MKGRAEQENLHQHECGNVLMTLVVFLAIAIIGAMVASTLFLVQQNQLMTLETQKRLESAFKALFPLPGASPASRPANMYKDFGFKPKTTGIPGMSGYATNGWPLTCLMSPGPGTVGAIDPNNNPPANFSVTQKGWNGPYWQLSVNTQNQPLDAWGRPLQLRYVTSPSTGFQIYSRGANGVDNTTTNSGTPGGDDLVYPATPYVLPVTAVCFQDLVRANGTDLGGKWKINGDAAWVTSAARYCSSTFMPPGYGVTINTCSSASAGSVIYTNAVDPRNMTISFDFVASGGTASGGNGFSMVFLDVSQGMTTSYCSSKVDSLAPFWAGALGMKGVALAFDFFCIPYSNAPTDNYEIMMAINTGLANSGNVYYPGCAYWTNDVYRTSASHATRSDGMTAARFSSGASIMRENLVSCTVTIAASQIQATATASKSGNTYMLRIPTTGITFPSSAYVGFAGHSGAGYYDAHWVGNASICTN